VTPVSSELNHYETLGVHIQSNHAAIRQAWRLAAWEHHPDLKPTEERFVEAEHMRRVNEAYQVLSDPARRRRYDLEHGLLPATCGNCGKPGSLRLDERGQTVPVCGECFRPGQRVFAL
jgi:DnaJ-class molecular chaperone